MKKHEYVAAIDALIKANKHARAAYEKIKKEENVTHASSHGQSEDFVCDLGICPLSEVSIRWADTESEYSQSGESKMNQTDIITYLASMIVNYERCGKKLSPEDVQRIVEYTVKLYNTDLKTGEQKTTDERKVFYVDATIEQVNKWLDQRKSSTQSSTTSQSGESKMENLNAAVNYENMFVDPETLDKMNVLLKEQAAKHSARFGMPIPSMTAEQIFKICSDYYKGKSEQKAANANRQFIIGSIDVNGNYSFSNRPVVHRNEESARTEAERLAKVNAGKTFVYVELHGKVKTEEPKVKWA